MWTVHELMAGLGEVKMWLEVSHHNAKKLAIMVVKLGTERDEWHAKHDAKCAELVDARNAHAVDVAHYMRTSMTAEDRFQREYERVNALVRDIENLRDQAEVLERSNRNLREAAKDDKAYVKQLQQQIERLQDENGSPF